MTSTLITKKQRGLDQLVNNLVSGYEINPNNFLSYIDESLEQLERDDNISPKLTDLIVDSLLDARELFLDGQEPWEALEEMLSYYQQAKQEKSFFQQWTDKANHLSQEELRSELWDQFQRACTMAENGQGAVLLNWLNEKIKSFEGRQEDYESMLISAREVTMESTLCHLFLNEGMRAWKEALQGLREVCSGSVSAAAEARLAAERGQRFLVAVQMYEREAALVESKYFVNYN